MKRSILYIINFYGTPPLNYIEKYINETKEANLTILKLPAIRSSKNRLALDAFIKDETGKEYPMHINLLFPFPYFFIFFIQYILNGILTFLLLRKIERKQFDIIIGEANFGSAVSYLLKKIGIGKYTVFFNGDILPDPSSSKHCFFLPNKKSRIAWLLKHIDTLILSIQLFLRKLGYNNDLVWYCNNRIKEWDKRWNLQSKDAIVRDPILIDYAEFKRYEEAKKDMSALCYIGRIDDYVGLDIIIPSLVQIKKKIPAIKLHIIGGNEVTIEKYKHLVKHYKLENHVKFYGYLPKAEDAFEIMSHCALGMALYKPVPDNVSMIAQPAKPKEYIKAGVPPLLTINGPEIGREIVQAKAGLMSKFDREAVASIITKTLMSEENYETLQQGVKTYAKQNHYAVILAQVLHEITQKYQRKVSK